MKKLLYTISAILVAGIIVAFIQSIQTIHKPSATLDKHLRPYDHFFLQRSYPDTIFAYRAFSQALNLAVRHSETQLNHSARSGDGFNEDWNLEGPGNIGGRINAFAVHPTNNNIIYAGTASGGIFKTTDGGTSWNPIFDNHPYLAISDITLDPSNPDIVYAGTGDHNISGYPFIGDGVYRSMDGGQSWSHLGLSNESIISRIIVDPTDSLTIYAAAMGLPFVRNNDRGLYKSTDGGITWNQVLFVSNQAGIIDLVMDPFNSQILYTASWDRIRNNSESTVSGPNAKIWKTTDGGANWTQLTSGLPSGNQCRIGLAISENTAGVLAAIYVDATSPYDLQGVYKTANGGTSWTNASGNLPAGFLGGFGWYFGQIRINPSNINEMWALGVQLYKTTNGGVSWSSFGGSTHVDYHDLVFASGNTIFLASDGGGYKTTNGGASWTDFENIPNNQFYRIALNPHIPGTYYGGLQDNGSVGGNSSGINNWAKYFGGDGFQLRFDPNNASVWYCQTQNGGLWYSINGGNSFNFHGNALTSSDRRNWDMPFILSHNNPDVQYCGTFRVYRNSTGPGGYWLSISPDLTDGIIFGSNFHTISTVNESPLDSNVIYAGTTDGNVWVSTNYGTGWTDITDTLPDRYVTSVKPSPVDSATAFVTHSGYKDNDFFPHIHKTTDYGTTWQDISGDLPPLAINDLYIYPTNDSIIFVATDGGVYGTLNSGTDWKRVGANMPFVAVYDLEIDTTQNLLVAGTFGRSLYTYPLDSIFNPAPPPPQPAVAIIGNATICEGDSVILSAPAGYEAYQWSNGDSTQNIVVFDSGSYDVIVFQNGCPSPVSVPVSVTVIPAPPQPVISASGGLSFCQGDSVTLSAPVGFASYLWSDGAFSQSIVVKDSGIFEVMVTENGCDSDHSLPVEVIVFSNPEQPVIIPDGPLVICEGTQLTLSAPEGFSSYQWNTGAQTASITAMSSGSFSVVVTDSNNCVSPASDTVITSTLALPSASFSYQNSGTQVIFNDSSENGTTYSWDFGDGTTSNDSSGTHIFPGSGIYTVSLIVSNDCGSDTMVVDISVIATNLDQPLWMQAVEVYPNPSAGTFFVRIRQTENRKFTVRMFDLQGKVCIERETEAKPEILIELQPSNLSEGIYLLNIQNGEHQVTERIMIRK